MHSKRKLMILATALGCLLLLPVMANADYVQVGDILQIYASPQGASDGAFVVTDLTNSNASFRTFCVQTNEFVYLGSSNYYRVEGISSNVIFPIPGTPLSERSAYVFSQYLANKATIDSSSTLQNTYQGAIWYGQGIGGINSSGHLFNNVPQDLGTNVDTTVYNTLIGAAVSGFYGVQVMNLDQVTPNSSGGYTFVRHAQDMLTPVPLPGAVLLLGAGLARLVAYARLRQED
jgi:hypothetical protein